MRGLEINCRGSSLLVTIEFYVAIEQEAENHKNGHQDRQASVPCFFFVGLFKQVGVL
jgi:hypothetical protein